MTITNTLDKLNWRYATKNFDSTKKLTPDQLGFVLEAFRLSPSSFGIQGWKFVHVKDIKTRSLLRGAAWDQAQVTDSSEFFVLTVPTNYAMSDVDEYLKAVAASRGAKVEELAGYRGMIGGVVTSLSQDKLVEWLKKQVYIALGQVMAVCAVEEIDTCPMEGFDNNKFDEILGIKDMNLTSVVCLAVGFRSTEDKYALAPKVRYPKEKVVLEI